MRKLGIILVIIGILIAMAGISGCGIADNESKKGELDPAKQQGVEKDVVVLDTVPVQLEKENPVPTVKTWNENNRSIYYFSWGVKPTGGYALELQEVTGNKIILKAISPDPEAMVMQVLTFPALTLSLPAGEYDYEVRDEAGKVIENFFQVTNPPLEITLFIPYEGSLVERKVLRDPYDNNEGKTTGHIALEALFSQEEMMSYGDKNVMVSGVSFTEKEWVVLLSIGYESLGAEEKQQLEEQITKTMLALGAKDLKSVVITTDPKELPPLVN